MTIRIRCMRLVKYDRHMNMSVIDSSKPSLLLLEPFPVNEFAKCPAKCNNEPDCEVVTLNSSNYCSIYSSQVTVLDVQVENGTLLLAKNPIKECLDSDYFADTNEMVCKQKFTEGMTCSRNGECSYDKGLFCKYGTCQCMKNPDYM